MHLIAAAPHPEFVQKDLVHKANADEVLLTGWTRRADDTFTVSAHWPTAHSYYVTRRNHVDLMLLNETVRQVFPLLCHEAYGVPLGHHLLWDTYEYEITPAALLAEELSGPVELHVRCLGSLYRGTRLTALSLLITVTRDGVELATARTRLTVQAPAIYQRLRHGRGAPGLVRPLPPSRPAAGILPQHIGRSSLNDMVLSPTGTGAPCLWQLRVDTGHPLFFDHPVDHVPGLLLIEAALQAAQSVTHPRRMTPVGMETRFKHYVELDTPCLIEVQQLLDDPLGRAHLSITMRQEGVENFAAVVRLSPASGSRSERPLAGIIPSSVRTTAQLVP
ncbi:ScbA/BarX family gamma-butyrolactone biosynthesis protein [Streptomyces sp. BE230]|uniref:ScbA/BarX family gamma-butyrolactone biosynthesis protein n=1 Tax=Streptomyces sp. BE230 TaxID=3002526 RepID=UPI002ED16142|nr:ScbA/BarX family gamma-butyrolactone biosynthesis protein [Streptomyces sp. BE230]